MRSSLLQIIARDRYPAEWKEVIDAIAEAFNFESLGWYDPLLKINSVKHAVEAMEAFKVAKDENKVKSMANQIGRQIIELSKDATTSIINKYAQTNGNFIIKRLQMVDENLVDLLNCLPVNNQHTYSYISGFFLPKTLNYCICNAMDKGEPWVGTQEVMLELLTRQMGKQVDYIEDDYSENEMFTLVSRALDQYSFNLEDINFLMLNTLARYWTGFSKPLAEKLNSMGVKTANYTHEEIAFIWENVCFQQLPLEKLNFMLEVVGLSEPAYEDIENLHWLKSLLISRNTNMLSTVASDLIATSKSATTISRRF